MSLSIQRVSSIALVAIGAGVLFWSEYSGIGGPAQAGATEQLPLVGTLEASAGASGLETGGNRIAIAGLLREYAQTTSVDVSDIEDPFVDPAAWAVVREVVLQPDQQASEAQPLNNGELVLTAVLDSPHGAVARVNGHLLVVGKPVEILGIGPVSLIEVGSDSRSALLKTERGTLRIQLQQTFGG